ncbi:MAG: proline dehydrogenase [Gemmatimonadetes bacterium]|nr:MAG: proline dehydrogenase [Gemmatimonadota bacterium]
MLLRNGLIHLSESPTAKKLVTGTPLRAMSRRFVPGETVEELIAAVREANAQGLRTTANYLGEAEKSRATATEAADRYLEVIERIHAEGLEGNVSLKFTQLGQAIDDAFLAENLGRVLERARQTGVFIRFDMESSDYTQRTLDAFEKLWADGWRDIGVVLQAYLKRTESDVRRMIELGARVRLCKGAYAEPPEVAFQDRHEVDRNFVRLMRMLLREGNFPAIATHDEAMIRATVEFARAEGIAPDRFEFQMLYGVRRDLQTRLVDEGWGMRVYVPFGEHWYPYLMRRLAERPANVLFLAGSVVQESKLGFLWPGGRRDGRKG